MTKAGGNSNPLKESYHLIILCEGNLFLIVLLVPCLVPLPFFLIHLKPYQPNTFHPPRLHYDDNDFNESLNQKEEEYTRFIHEFTKFHSSSINHFYYITINFG